MSDLTAPKTLADILAFLDAADTGVINATPEQMAEMGAALVAKVDGTAEFIDELEFQAERLRVASAKLAEGKRQVLARVERLKDYIAFHMKLASFTTIPGEVWKVHLTSSEAVEPTCDPDPVKYPGFVRTKHEWDKAALKAAIRAENPVAMAVAKLAPSNSVDFKPNKGKLLR